MKPCFLPLLLTLVLSIGASVAQAAAPRLISFSGFTWWVKASQERVGPGPNYFSDTTDHVWVDADGRLHLRIDRSRGKWFSAEVVCTESLGHGTYRFLLDSDVSGLDPNVVLGLFTWSDASSFNNREIDIEFSRWGDPGAPNAQFVVQPYYVPGNLWAYFLPSDLNQTTHSFAWLPEAVWFQSAAGHHASVPGAVDLLAEYVYAGPDVPPAGDETPRINLWLRQGLKPTNKRSVEVVIRQFVFEPL